MIFILTDARPWWWLQEIETSHGNENVTFYRTCQVMMMKFFKTPNKNKIARFCRLSRISTKCFLGKYWSSVFNFSPIQPIFTHGVQIPNDDHRFWDAGYRVVTYTQMFWRKNVFGITQQHFLPNASFNNLKKNLFYLFRGCEV